MTTKSSSNPRNSKTGSYTVRVQKSAVTGKFVSGPRPQGKISVKQQPRKAS